MLKKVINSCYYEFYNIFMKTVVASFENIKDYHDELTPCQPNDSKSPELSFRKPECEYRCNTPTIYEALRPLSSASKPIDKQAV